MGAIVLEGFWLLGALSVVYLVGVFTSQWAKDKLAGIPSDLRKALRATEAAAKIELAAAQAKVVADTAKLLSNAKAKVSADLAPVAASVAVNPSATSPVA